LKEKVDLIFLCVWTHELYHQLGIGSLRPSQRRFWYQWQEGQPSFRCRRFGIQRNRPTSIEEKWKLPPRTTTFAWECSWYNRKPIATEAILLCTETIGEKRQRGELGICRCSSNNGLRGSGGLSDNRRTIRGFEPVC
jgi:hypothetical protein